MFYVQNRLSQNAYTEVVDNLQRQGIVFDYRLDEDTMEEEEEEGMAGEVCERNM
jgi:hypothetical protein